MIPPEFSCAAAFVDGLALMRWKFPKTPKFGFIDYSGAYVFGTMFDDAWGFRESLAAVKNGQRWGYIDRTGRFVIPPTYKHARSSLKDGHGFCQVNCGGTSILRGGGLLRPSSSPLTTSTVGGRRSLTGGGRLGSTGKARYISDEDAQQ